MEDKGIIKLGDKTFKSSEYQIEIFNEIEHGVGNLVIDAAAGSAKTTTIENALRFISPDKKKMFLAFNVSTVEKLRSEIPNSEGTLIVTFHGLGYRLLRENNTIDENCTVDDYKYVRYVKSEIDNISVFGEHKTLGTKSLIYMQNIISLINYARYYMKIRAKDIAKVAEIYGIIAVRDEFEVVRQALIWGKEHTDVIDHTDMIWLPNELNLQTRKYKYDFIFIDEAQDTTIAHQELVDKCFKRGCRFAAVGDPNQQINVWCGATDEAIENYKKREGTKTFNLPISYRCPKRIVEMAKKYSANIQASSDAIDGIVRYDVSPNDAKPGDMVLCRIISKLIDQYLSYLRNNKKAFLKGNDAVRETFLNMISATDAKLIDRLCLTKNGLIPQLYRTYFELRDRLSESVGEFDNSILYNPELINMYDNIEAIKVLAEGLTTVDELVKKIKDIFIGDEKDAIILSTVHKAKGLEADNIFILCPSLLPSQIAKKDWEIKAEKNLTYVAITRAKKTLSFIKEEKKGFFANFFGGKSMISELEEIEKHIGYESKLKKEKPKAIKTVPEKEEKKINNPQKKKPKFFELTKK